jgi:hypothetical protein
VGGTVVSARESDADIEIPIAQGFRKLNRAFDILEPAGSFLWQRPEQQIEIIRLAGEECFQEMAGFRIHGE